MRGVNNEVCFAICETEWSAYERFKCLIEYMVMLSEKNPLFRPFLGIFEAYKRSTERDLETAPTLVKCLTCNIETI